MHMYICEHICMYIYWFRGLLVHSFYKLGSLLWVSSLCEPFYLRLFMSGNSHIDVILLMVLLGIECFNDGVRAQEAYMSATFPRFPIPFRHDTLHFQRPPSQAYIYMQIHTYVCICM